METKTKFEELLDLLETFGVNSEQLAGYLIDVLDGVDIEEDETKVYHHTRKIGRLQYERLLYMIKAIEEGECIELPHP